MTSDFVAFRENVTREMKRQGLEWKDLESKSGVCRTTLTVVLQPNVKNPRPLRENHMEGISEALGVPLSRLFMSPDELALNSKEAEIMVEIKECLELMVTIPEFKRGILARCDELKRMFRDEVAVAKKKMPSKMFNFLK